MGCLQSLTSGGNSQLKDEEEPPKVYSWDKRDRVDPKDFTIENLKDATAGRVPGTINGQQFIIQNCEDSNIFILDHTNTITVDDCTNCRIFLGPIKTSVFIRNCKDCKFMIACQQFRTRDCQKMDVFLACVTQPIIEASTGLKFGCFQYFYPELAGQFQRAENSVYNNNWSNVHDFTPVPGENNYSLLSEDINVAEIFPIPTTAEFADMQISMDLEQSSVPRTLGTRRKPSTESCLVIFFYDGGSHDRAAEFMREMKAKHDSCVLIQTKEIAMRPEDATRVVGSENYAMAVQQGPVIGFEYNGDNVCTHCQENVVAITQGTTGVVFVSTNAAAAAQQIENFYNFADMQMNA